MVQALRVGVLALQGGVAEHLSATRAAAKNLSLTCDVVEVRTKTDLTGLHGLIIPGGESTTLQKLCEREGMFDDMRKVPALFGTCAGAIMLAKKISNKEADQRTLGLMDIEIDRNGYGRQLESFEKTLQTELGEVRAVFIRAPRIASVGAGVYVLARHGGANNCEAIACEQQIGKHYLMATCFHPELACTIFHERFLTHLKP